MFWAGLLQPPLAQRGPFRLAPPPVLTTFLGVGGAGDADGAASVDALTDGSEVEADGSTMDVDGAVSVATSSPAPPRTGIQRSNVLAGGMW